MRLKPQRVEVRSDVLFKALQGNGEFEKKFDSFCSCFNSSSDIQGFITSNELTKLENLIQSHPNPNFDKEFSDKAIELFGQIFNFVDGIEPFDTVVTEAYNNINIADDSTPVTRTIDNFLEYQKLENSYKITNENNRNTDEQIFINYHIDFSDTPGNIAIDQGSYESLLKPNETIGESPKISAEQISKDSLHQEEIGANIYHNDIKLREEKNEEILNSPLINDELLTYNKQEITTNESGFDILNQSSETTPGSISQTQKETYGHQGFGQTDSNINSAINFQFPSDENFTGE